MQLNFKQFKRLLFESLLEENKNHIIDKLVLPDLKNDPNEPLFDARKNYKNILKAFFFKYPNYENKIDWNKWQTLTKAEFDAVMELPNNSRKARRERERREANNNYKALFQNVNGRKFKPVGETYDWYFVAPLNYEAAVYCDSQECGGGSAKWCIGYEKNTDYWDQYIHEGSKFIMAFNKHFNTMPEKDLYSKLKYMIQETDDNEIVIWNQADNTLDTNTALTEHLNFLSKNELYKMLMDLSISEYELPEINTEGFVINIKDNRIKDYTYYPPENAWGIDFSKISPFFYEKKIRNIFIPKTVKVISPECFKRWSLDKVIFENNRTDYIEILEYAFARAIIKDLQFPNLVSVSSRILAFALISNMKFPKTYKHFDVECNVNLDDYSEMKEFSTDIGTDLSGTNITTF